MIGRADGDRHDASALTIPRALLERRADLHAHAEFELEGGAFIKLMRRLRLVACRAEADSHRARIV
jgi:hypothetical protein